MSGSTGFEPDLSKWDAWRPEDAARLFAEVDAPWYVAAGWAIDLFLGGQRREHEDLEIAVPRDRLGEILDALDGCEFFVAGVSGPDLVTPLGEADADALEISHQTWVRERATGIWRLDVFTEPADGDTWICRRDESIRLPYDEVIAHTPDGIPTGVRRSSSPSRPSTRTAPGIRRISRQCFRGWSPIGAGGSPGPSNSPIQGTSGSSDSRSRENRTFPTCTRCEGPLQIASWTGYAETWRRSCAWLC